MRIMRTITIPGATGTPLSILAYPFNTHTRGAFLRIWYVGNWLSENTRRGRSSMKSSMRVLLVTLALPLVLALSALPAAADDFGPAFFCDAQAFSNCTDTSNPALAEDTFSCEGTVGDVASCTNQI